MPAITKTIRVVNDLGHEATCRVYVRHSAAVRFGFAREPSPITIAGQTYWLPLPFWSARAPNGFYTYTLL